ncbi:MAG TPA: hypothetical protein VM716_05660 [Gemmatimonadales bacterium]|nr:hypothetical protein [Gemmatimonadales bacterium]
MILMLLAVGARGQDSQRSPWTGGARAATVQLNDSLSLRALSGVMEYRALGWLRLGAAPTLVRATSGATTTSGFGDLPLALEASGQWSAPFRPELGASVIVTLPTGRAACGLGSGVTSVGMSLGAGIAPAEAVHLSADASRSFTGAITLSSLDKPDATWVDIDGDVDVAPRLTLSLSVGGAVGGIDTTTADREVGGGVSYALRGPLELKVDVTHRVAGTSPRWGVEVSLGTSSTGISPLNSLSPVGRERQVFVSGISNGRGRGRGVGGGGGGTGGGTVGC